MRNLTYILHELDVIGNILFDINQMIIDDDDKTNFDKIRCEFKGVNHGWLQLSIEINEYITLSGYFVKNTLRDLLNEIDDNLNQFTFYGYELYGNSLVNKSVDYNMFKLHYNNLMSFIKALNIVITNLRMENEINEQKNN